MNKVVVVVVKLAYSARKNGTNGPAAYTMWAYYNNHSPWNYSKMIVKMRFISTGRI